VDSVDPEDGVELTKETRMHETEIGGPQEPRIRLGFGHKMKVIVRYEALRVESFQISLHIG
jgi:hypothetical protein